MDPDREMVRQIEAESGKGELQRQGKGTERNKGEAGGEDETEKDGETRKTGRDRRQETSGEQEGEIPGERARKGKRKRSWLSFLIGTLILSDQDSMLRISFNLFFKNSFMYYL